MTRRAASGTWPCARALWKPGDVVAGLHLVRIELDGDLIGPASDGRSNKVVWWFSHTAGGSVAGVVSLNNLIGKVLAEEDRASSGG